MKARAARSSDGLALATAVADASLRVHALERKMDELREVQTITGYELVAARMDLRQATARLEVYDIGATAKAS